MDLSRGAGMLVTAPIKTITFTGAASLGAVGTVPLWTVTGRILLVDFSSFCTTLLTTTGAATLAAGVTGTTGGLVAATTATDIDANEWWVDTAPDTGLVALPAACKDTLISTNIFLTVAAFDISTGVMEFYCHYIPLSSGAGLT
jgi:hypothetical protein